ncbi:MAG: hypothetical protein HZA24_11940 [Nitrospirae bacterium]|nr:hypothetical protein [Nitrospirota bacterium]
MIEIYGHRWTSQYGEIPEPGSGNPAMTTWARGLLGIPAAHVALGLHKLVRAHEPWPPSLPAFRALCQPTPDDFGLPPADAAWEEARRAFGGPNRRRAWSHPAVRLAARLVRRAGIGPGMARENAFRHAYRLLCQRVMAGIPLSEPLPDGLLPSPAEPPASAEEARAHLAALKAIALRPAAREERR